MGMSLIVAMDKNRVIGYKNKLPWHLPNDLKYVKEVTMDKPLIMGRKNFESIGKPLPGRRNIVLTRNNSYKKEGIEVIHDINDVIKLANEEEVFIFGGEEIYKLFLPYVGQMYITKINGEFEGDTYFPEIDFKEWKLISYIKGKVDDRNKFEHGFYIYEKEKEEI